MEPTSFLFYIAFCEALPSSFPQQMGGEEVHFRREYTRTAGNEKGLSIKNKHNNQQMPM